MAWTTITEPAIGDATKKNAFAKAVIDNLEDLNARVGTGGGATGLPNSSFEDDSDADGDPDGWTITETGGTQTLENDTDAESSHGAQSIKFTYPASASGGGYMETTDLIACSPGQILKLAWKMKLDSSDGAKNIVRVYWFDYAEAALTGGDEYTDAFSDTGAPTDWRQCYTESQAPTDAKYFKVRVIASDTSATPSGAGAVWFDDFRLVNGPRDVFNNSLTVGFQDNNAQVDASYDPTWLSPSSVGLCWVECIGGGGGGSGTANWGAGGGGAYSSGYFIYASSTRYNCQAGAAGGDATNGGDSTFNSTTVVAKGGEGSEGVSNPGEGGAAGSGTGVIKISGGDGSGATYGGNGARGGAGARSGGASGGTQATWPGGGGGGDQYTSYDAVSASGMVRVWWND